MKEDNLKPLTPKLQAELDTLAAMPDSEINASEMPEIIDWSSGVRGALYHPVMDRLTDEGKLIVLRAAIDRGLASGIAEPGTMDRIRKKFGLPPKQQGNE